VKVPATGGQPTSERFWINLQARYDLEVEKDRLGASPRAPRAGANADCQPERQNLPGIVTPAALMARLVKARALARSRTSLEEQD
jgi:hypothetical protein